LFINHMYTWSKKLSCNCLHVCKLCRGSERNKLSGATGEHFKEAYGNSKSSTCTPAACMHGLKRCDVTACLCATCAGSERNKLSGATGEHFKEACSINKSLTCLGRVIMELVEAQRQGRRHIHIPYRDSRLTFLLQVQVWTYICPCVRLSVCLCQQHCLEWLEAQRQSRRHIYIPYRDSRFTFLLRVTGCPYACLSVCPFVRQSVCLSVHPSVCTNSMEPDGELSCLRLIG